MGRRSAPKLVLPGVAADALRNRGDKVYRNPKESVIARMVPNQIRRHHAFRALQVLKLNLDNGRFPATEFDMFIGPGVANAIGDDASRKRPTGTTRRGIRSLATVDDWLPFPGRIYFTSGQTNDLALVVEEFIQRFIHRAPLNRSRPGKKTHNTSYRTGLAWFVGDQPVSSAEVLKTVLRDDAPIGVPIRAINIAPHASWLEWRRLGVMHAIVGELRKQYGPAIQSGFSYINSDLIGVTYSQRQGGPSPATAQASGRPYPVVYALPMATFFIPGNGLSNATYSSLRAANKPRRGFRNRRRRRGL